MPWQVSPQTRFLLRASLFFAGLLVVWWFVLLQPLLAWTRISTDLILNALPGAGLQTGVIVKADGVWALLAPVTLNGQVRNVRLEAPQRLPTQLTIGAPLLWAILLAAPRSRSTWRALLIGTAVVLLLPPIGLLAYAAHVAKIYLYPTVHPVAGYFLGAADYVASTVAPYVGPVLLAMGLNTELRALILLGETQLPPVATRR